MAFLCISLQAYTIQGQYAIPHPDVSANPQAAYTVSTPLSERHALTVCTPLLILTANINTAFFF